MMRPKLKAIHCLVYGNGKTAQPGELVELNREDFSGAAEVESLVARGAVEIVEPERGAEPEVDPEPVRRTPSQRKTPAQVPDGGASKGDPKPDGDPAA